MTIILEPIVDNLQKGDQVCYYSSYRIYGAGVTRHTVMEVSVESRGAAGHGVGRVRLKFGWEPKELLRKIVEVPDEIIDVHEFSPSRTNPDLCDFCGLEDNDSHGPNSN